MELLESRTFRMKVLEVVAALAIGLATMLVLVVGSLFAVGSMGRVVRIKSM